MSAPGLPAMIFAAGLGTRMGALTADRPKPLLKAGGRTLLDHALAIAREAGCARIVVNAHAHADQIASHLAAHAPDALLSREPVRLETGGGLRAALPLIGAPASFTLNADAVWAGLNPFALLQAAWDPARSDALLCLVPRAMTRAHLGRGDAFLGADGGVAWRGEAAEAPFVYAGAGIVATAPVAAEPEEPFSLRRIWEAARARGRLHAVIHPGPWVDVGHPAGLDAAEALLAQAQPTAS